MGKKKSLILALILCLLVLAGCEPDPPVQYTITYHVLDGASNPSSNPSSYTVETSTIQLADPSRTGYTFAGWYSSASYTGEAITHIPQGSSGPKHLYAKWTGNTYTVSFDSNDQAIQNPDPQDLIFGQAYASLPTLTKAYYGHTWNTVQNGSGTTITNATTLSTAQNHTLYAQWTPTQYTITYTLNEGQNSSSNPATYTVETSTITLADPSRDGYSFASWYTEAAFTTQVTTIAQGSHDNLNLHAKWTANSYTVSFDSQDSQIADPGAQNIAFGQTYASLPNLSKTGYSHTWNTAQNGSGTTITNATTLSIADHHTLYAQWIPNTYTVTLDKQSGSGGSSTVTATYAAAMPNATAPTRTGYTFGGYYTSTNGGGNQYYTQAMASTQNWNLTANTTLYAKWEPVTYTLTYHLNSGTAPSPDNPTTYTIETNTITLKNPTRTYYSFLRWYAESTFETVQTTIPEGTSGNKNFYAKWSADSYTITYELYGGTNNNQNPDRYTYESNTITLANPSRTGYTFAGWFAESTYNTQITFIANHSHGDKTVHAKWTANTYTVTFDKRSGSGGSDSVAATYDVAMPTATAPTRTGYTFGGYYSAINGGGTQYYTQAMASSRTWDLASHTTLYAMWTPLSYTLTYHLNSGTAPSPDNPATYTIETSTITLKNPNRTGYTFAGWFDNSELTGSAVTQIPLGSYGNKNFYANWTANTYTVTFDKQSGSGGSDSVTATFAATMPTATYPIRYAYTFEGYFTAAEGAGTQYYTQDMASSRAWDLASHTTLYAKWTPITYTLTYHLNGGTAPSPNNPATYTIETSTITLANPTRTGYTFAGWYAEAGFSTQVTTIDKGSSGDKDLYAKWTPITYNLTYHLNSGTAPSPDNPATYTIETSTFDLADPARDYYAFNGWYAEPSFNTQVSTITHGSYGDRNLYAKWLPIEYTITYVLKQDMINHADNPSSYTVESDAITLKDPTRQGYYFGGWFTESTLDNLKLQIPLGSHGDVTLHPKWNYTYQVGDLTPAPEYGFIVFDRNSQQSTLDPYDYREANPWRYLVAANYDYSNLGNFLVPWTPSGQADNFFNPETGGDQGPYGDIGNGLGASQAVVDYYGAGLSYAALAAQQTSGWFLPSLGELQCLMSLFVSSSVGNISLNTMYWSSTDIVNAGNAYMQRVNESGSLLSLETECIYDKDTLCRVRPFRRL